MNSTYTNDGIIYDLEYRGRKIEFPLSMEDKGYRKTIRSMEWEKVAILEQLWICGRTRNTEESKYLLCNEEILELDSSDREILGIPEKNVSITIFEKGNLGSSNYQIGWEAYRNGLCVGHVVRYGCILKSIDSNYILNKDQYQLVTQIDNLEDTNDFSERSKNISKIKKYAGKSDISTDSFTNSRDFHYVDEVNMTCEKVSDQEIIFLSEIVDEPDIPYGTIDKEVDNVLLYEASARRNYVFFSEEAKRKYNTYNKMPVIRGVDVPRFLDNPLSYIDEEIEFDQDDFANRVKGIKIHKSSAQPYVAIERKKDEPGWFEVSAGVRLEPYGDEYDSFKQECALDAEEYRQLVDKAKENGEEYVYYKNQWIKVDAEEGEKYFEELEAIDEELEDGKISESKLRKVLDIYENIEGFEYNETDTELIKSGTRKLYAVPDSFNGVLKPYQVEGFSFLCSQNEMGMGSLFADDMGLGKTAQVIAFMLFLKERGILKPALIVVPKILTDNWVGEIRKFAPCITSIYVHTDSNRYRNTEMIEEYEVVITTYETLSRDQLLLGKIHWRFMACDETQKIKNYKTLAASAVKGMNADCRIAMTGTPVENRLGELWSIVDYVQPGLLRDYSWFKKTYEEPIQSHECTEYELVNQLVSLINPIFLRRLKDEVLSGLPVKTENKYHIRMSRLQSDAYHDILSNYKENSGNMIVLKTIQELIEVCSHPRVWRGDVNEKANKLISESGKLEDTVQLLEKLERKNEKVLVFTKYKRMQLILKKVIMEKFGIDPKVINGEVAANRQDIINGFNNSKGFNVMILSPKAAGVGLTITGANNVIHYTREWNPAIENQATDRVYRIGQERDVNVFYPITIEENMFTVEQKLDMLLENKRQLMRDVIIPVDLNIKQSELEECLI